MAFNTKRKAGSLEKNIPLTADEIDSNFKLLNFFLESYHRRPQVGSDSPFERKMANFMYRMSSSKNEAFKTRLNSVLFSNGFFIKDVKNTDEILAELEEFMIRYHRFPLSSSDDDEKRLYNRAFSYVNKGNNPDAVSKIEELVLLYDVANTCTLFTGATGGGISHQNSVPVFCKEFFSPVLARDISTGVVKISGLSARFENGSFVLSKRGLPDTVVPPEGVYLVIDGPREYFAIEDKNGALSEIKESRISRQVTLPDDLKKQIDAHIHLTLVPGREEDSFKVNSCLDSVDFTLFMHVDGNRSSVSRKYYPYAGDSLIFCSYDSRDTVGSCAREFLSQLPDEYLGSRSKNPVPLCLNIDVRHFSEQEWITFFGYLEKAGIRLSGIVSDDFTGNLTRVKLSGKCSFLNDVRLDVSCTSRSYRIFREGYYGYPHLYPSKVIDSYLGVNNGKKKSGQVLKCFKNRNCKGVNF